MKTFKGRKQETLLLIEESDLDDKIASKLRGRLYNCTIVS